MVIFLKCIMFFKDIFRVKIILVVFRIVNNVMLILLIKMIIYVGRYLVGNFYGYLYYRLWIGFYYWLLGLFYNFFDMLYYMLYYIEIF